MAVQERRVSIGASRKGTGLIGLNCTISKLISNAMRWQRSVTTITAKTSCTFLYILANCSGETVLFVLNCACVMRMLKVGSNCVALRQQYGPLSEHSTLQFGDQQQVLRSWVVTGYSVKEGI